MEGLGVGELLAEPLDQLDVLTYPSQLGGQAAGTLLVVPEIGGTGLLLQLGETLTRVVEPQVLGRVLDPSPEVAQVVGVITHRWGPRLEPGQRPWQYLNFLPLPQSQGSFRPGVFSTRIGSWGTSGAWGWGCACGWPPTDAGCASGWAGWGWG